MSCWRQPRERAEARAVGPWTGALHFVGVGGAGMSGYARAAHALGAEVSGSDAAGSALYWSAWPPTVCCEASVGHAAANVPAGEGVEVVYSSAVPPENPERVGARASGASRAPARRAAGGADRAAAHDRGGRHARQDDDRVDARARAARRRPRAGLAGGRPGRRRPGERGVGSGRVAGGRGRRVRPLDAEPEGRDRGADQRRARPPRELRLARGAARGVPRVPGTRRAQAVVSGTAPSCSRCARSGRGDRGRSLRRDRADARRRGLALPAGAARRSAWRVPGAHNALNAAGALEAARLAGADAALAIEGLAGFHGAGRRFQLLGADRARRGRVRRLRPPPDRGRGDAGGGAHARAPAAGGGVPAPPVLAHGAARARVRRGAGARRRGGACSTSTPRASAPRTSPG